MMSFLMFAGFVVFAFTFAIGMWAFGRWLRSKGYGPQLDKLDRQYTALQLRVSPLAMSASYRMFVGGISCPCWVVKTMLIYATKFWRTSERCRKKRSQSPLKSSDHYSVAEPRVLSGFRPMLTGTSSVV